MNAWNASPLRFPPGHGSAGPGRSIKDVRVNGEPERWLVAARLSRVAKRDRERGEEVINGIQTQDARSTEWAQHEGHVIVHVARDRNVSGAIAPWERPELGPWLTDPIKIVQYDGIVAYDVSRISREYFDLAWLRKWAEENHKKLHVIKERLRWPDNRDGTLWDVAAERAYEERQDAIERITRELAALREAGKLTGRSPFGYTSEGDKYDRHLVPTDQGRTYLPKIYQHCIDGWSLKRIAQWLNSEGVKPPTSKGWWANSVGQVIKNPVYKGHLCERENIPPDETEERDGKVTRYRYGEIWVESPRWQYGMAIHRCDPLVNAATWKHANEALSTRGHRGHRDPESRAMLAEALSCAICEDSPMWRNGKEPYFYYQCGGRGSNRSSCGNMVRLELVDAAVNEIMASTFDVPVMQHEIVYGNEAEIEAEIERIKFELKHLAARELDWEEEDRERARLREEQTRVTNTTVVEDRVELVETDDTYLELWERLSLQDRGPWLAEHGFQITTSKERVTVTRGPASVTVELSAPKRKPAVRDTEPVYWGKCGCGCGADLNGVKWRRRLYVSEAHRMAAKRGRAVVDPEPVYWGKCECGCGTDLYGYARYGQKKYANAVHKKTAFRQRAAAAKVTAPFRR